MTEQTINSDTAFHVRFAKGYESMQRDPKHVPIMFLTSDDIRLEQNTMMCARNASLCDIVMQFRKNLVMDADTRSSTVGFIFYIKSENGKKILPKLTENVGNLYDRYHCSDMWLTVQIDKEDIFG